MKLSNITWFSRILFFLYLCSAGFASLFGGGSQEGSAQSLTVGMMPAVDIAPFYLARDKGLFSDEGVEVELMLFTNAQNRQTALQTGHIDGALSDLVALITNVDNRFPLKGTLSTEGVFPVLLNREALGGPLSALPRGAAISAGVMEISVTNYLMEQYLGTKHPLEKVFINEIPARLEAVASGQVQTGLFPEPVASIGILRGLEKHHFQGLPSQSVDIIVFTEKALEHKRSAVEAFHRAYGKAVRMIQKEPALAREMVVRYIPNIPPEIHHEIVFPEYLDPRLPSEIFIKELVAWTAWVTGKPKTLTYKQLIDPSFLPQRW